jgi:ketosteroid isomerase-like protein
MSPEEIVRAVVAAFAKADLKPLFDALHDDVLWQSASRPPKSPFIFGGEYRGRTGVIELVSKISTAYYFQRFAPKEIVTSGEIVWGIFDVEGSYLPPGLGSAAHRPLRFEIALRFRVRDAKILEVNSFFDTASLLVQQGGF